MSGKKLKLAIYGASACAGCDVAVLDIGTKLLDVAAAAEIVFWPVAMDCKLAQLEGFEEYNGNGFTAFVHKDVKKRMKDKRIIRFAFGQWGWCRVDLHRGREGGEGGR